MYENDAIQLVNVNQVEFAIDRSIDSFHIRMRINNINYYFRYDALSNTIQIAKDTNGSYIVLKSV